MAVVAVGCDGPSATGPSSPGPTASAASVPTSVTPADLTAAAEALCPPTWEWVKAIGAAFNDAAEDVRSIDSAEGRRARWFDALSEMRALDAGLGDTIEPWADDPVLGPIVAQMQRDLPKADDELDDLRSLFEQFPDLDDGPSQGRTQQLIVRVEKVIDLPKPDLDEIDPSGALGATFAAVPACQHSMKGANDGQSRFNG